MKLEYEVKDKVAYITINRPEAMNAMDMDVYGELSKAWIDVRDNPDIWVAIITGAASGIGREIAFGFVREGAEVVIFDINVAGMKEVAQQIEKETGKKRDG